MKTTIIAEPGIIKNVLHSTSLIGYAFNLVYRISKEFLDSGLEYCVLFTDDSNPISNHVYEKIGYERRADTMEILFI